MFDKPGELLLRFLEGTSEARGNFLTACLHEWHVLWNANRENRSKIAKRAGKMAVKTHRSNLNTNPNFGPADLRNGTGANFRGHSSTFFYSPSPRKGFFPANFDR